MVSTSSPARPNVPTRLLFLFMTPHFLRFTPRSSLVPFILSAVEPTLSPHKAHSSLSHWNLNLSSCPACRAHAPPLISPCSHQVHLPRLSSGPAHFYPPLRNPVPLPPGLHHLAVFQNRTLQASSALSPHDVTTPPSMLCQLPSHCPQTNS